MTKIFILAFTFLMSLNAFASTKHLFICSKRYYTPGKFTGVLYSVYVEEKDDHVVLTYLSCSGILNWGCGNGPTTVQESFNAIEENGSYKGEGISLSKDANNGYLLMMDSPVVAQEFTQDQCR